MKKRLKFVFVLCVIMILVFQTGCWDYREINRMAIVAGFAVDKESNGKYVVTSEIVDFESTGKESKLSSTLVSAKGDTIFEAIRSTLNYAGSKLYWGDAKVIIVSEQVANEGLLKILDVTLRDAEIRTDMDLIIAKGYSAAQILAQKSSTQDISAFEIRNMVMWQNSAEEAPEVEVYKYIDFMSGCCEAGYLPVISLEASGGKIVPALVGTAIMKNDKIAGYLSSKETQYFLLADNLFKRGFITLSEKDENSGSEKLTLEVFQTQAKTIPSVQNNQISIQIKIKVESTIAEIMGKADYTKENAIKELESDASKELKANITQVIQKVQNEYNADAFTFNFYLNALEPKEWDAVKDQWEQIYKTVPVDVEVDVLVRDSGKAGKTINMDGTL